MPPALDNRYKRPALVVLLALAVISPWPIVALSCQQDLKAQLVAIPSNGPTLAAAVSPTFSRGSYFLLVDLQSGKLKALENPFQREQHAVGVRCAALLEEQAVGVVIAKDIGPEPFGNLTLKGTRVFHTEADTVQEALLRYRQGQLVQLQQPSVPSHFGLDPNAALAGASPPCPLSQPSAGPEVTPATPVALPCYVGRLHRPIARNVSNIWPVALSRPQARPASGQPLQIPELGLELLPFADGGVQVQRVYPGSPAEQGGLVAGDFLLELGGRPVLDAVRLIFLVTTARPGSTLSVKLVRQGRVRTTSVTIPRGVVAGMQVPADAAPAYGLGRAPSAPGVPAAAARRRPGVPVQVPELGMEAVQLTRGGVAIYRVYKGSWAEKGGLKRGDVVLKLEGKSVRDMASFIQLVKAAAPEAPAPFTLIRQGQVVSAKVTVGEGEMETVTLPAHPAPAYSATAPAAPAKAPAPAAPAPAPAAGQPAAWSQPLAGGASLGRAPAGGAW